MSNGDDDTDKPNLLGALSIAEFCQRYGMSRSTYYNLPLEDRPRSFKPRRRRLILFRDAARWEEEMIDRYGEKTIKNEEFQKSNDKTQGELE